MKKTSRRNFAKQLTGVLAALPVAVLASAPGAGAQSKEQAKPRAVRPRDILTSHNTPPPLVIADGSLIIESDDPFIETSLGGGRFSYKGNGRPKISHIRVFQDNGDKIYEDLEDDTPRIDIFWKNEDDNASGQVTITGGATFLINSDKNFRRDAVKKRRPHKYDHQGGGAKRIRIHSIEITNSRGAKATFTAAPTGTGDSFIPDDFRILIWRH